MLAPFVSIFVCFAAGIVASLHWQLSYLIVFISIIPAALSLRVRNFYIALAAQSFFFFVLGWMHCQMQVEEFQGNSLKREVRYTEDKTVAVAGTILRAPEIADDFFVIHAHITSVARRQVDGVARITVSGTMTAPLYAGDRIETYARLRRPVNFGTTGAFDYELYLMKEGIHALGSVKSAALIHKSSSSRSIGSLTSRIRFFLIQQIRQNLDFRDADTLRALWLDDRTGMNRDTEQELIDAGIFHVIAISGFHVAVLIGIAFFAFRHFIPYRHALLLMSILLLFYFLLLEGRSSITRSFFTFLIFAFAFWRKETVSWATILFLSAFLQIAMNPLQIFDSGFHLTYLSTAAIVFLAVPLSSKIKLARKPYKYFLDFLITMISIQFVLLPYQAYVFHKIPFGSLLANFVAIPLSSILIGIAPFAFPAFGYFPPLKLVIHKILSLFFASSELFSGVWLEVVPTPAGWLLAAFYLSLTALPIFERRMIRTSSAAACMAIILSILWFHPEPEKGSLRIHIIDVGQGDSILLQYPDGTADMIDSGGFWNVEALDVGASLLLPYLSSLNITRLHRVFLTHAHADHMTGFLSLLHYVPCDEFYLTRRPLADSGFQTLVKTLPMKMRPLCKGSQFHQKDVLLKVLAPNDARNSLHVRNDDSLVVLVEYEGKRILLPGDAEKATEDQLCELPDIRADFLKVAHHGSKTSSNLQFLNNVKPKIAFISVGRNNWFGHPNPDVLHRLRRQHTMIYRTDQQGTIVLKIQNGEASVTSVYF